MRVVEPVAHGALLEGLWSAARARRLAHALLFTGPEGVGKFLAARALACGLLCTAGPGRPCEACGPCKRFAAGSHADVFVIDADSDAEEQIQISRITFRSEDSRPNVIDFLGLLPMEGGWRIVLIREAQRLNASSQNALLKTLEEPGSQVLIVLESPRADRLLPTTQSRCVKVRFSRLTQAATLAILAREGVPAAAAEVLARWSRGAPGAALAMHARGAISMRAILASALHGEAAAGVALEGLLDIDGEFPGRSASASARSRARAFLDLALSVLIDLFRARAGIPTQNLAHGDLAASLAPIREARLASQLEQCLAARQDVERNLAPEAALERALLAVCGDTRDLSPRRVRDASSSRAGAVP